MTLRSLPAQNGHLIDTDSKLTDSPSKQRQKHLTLRWAHFSVYLSIPHFFPCLPWSAAPLLPRVLPVLDTSAFSASHIHSLISTSLPVSRKMPSCLAWAIAETSLFVCCLFVSFYSPSLPVPLHTIYRNSSINLIVFFQILNSSHCSGIVWMSLVTTSPDSLPQYHPPPPQPRLFSLDTFPRFQEFSSAPTLSLRAFIL